VKISVLTSVLSILLSTLVSAQEMEVPVGIQVGFFFKILVFDRNLGNRVGNELNLGIVYQSKVKASSKVNDEFIEKVTASGINSIKGIPLRFIPVDLNTTELQQAIDDYGLDAIYVTPLQAIEVEQIAEICRKRKIISFSAVPRYLFLGLTLGIDQQGERPVILINIASAREVGADFSAQLLRLARILE
jgi:hypothetical protein